MDCQAGRDVVPIQAKLGREVVHIALTSAVTLWPHSCSNMRHEDHFNDL